MKYRVQKRDFLEHKRRAWGFGRVASYGPWRTVETAVSLEEARTAGRKRAAVGLAQWRILYGREKYEL
jgi:hypothetical protein